MLNLHRLTSGSSPIKSFPWLSPCLLLRVLLPLLLVTCNYFTYTAEERTWAYRKHISRDDHPPLRDVTAGKTETQFALLLRVWTCLRSRGLATGIHVTVYCLGAVIEHIRQYYYPLLIFPDLFRWRMSNAFAVQRYSIWDLIPPPPDRFIAWKRKRNIVAPCLREISL
jgi:hypothetical protein